MAFLGFASGPSLAEGRRATLASVTVFGNDEFGIRLEPDGHLFRIGLIINGELIGT